MAIANQNGGVLRNPSWSGSTITFSQFLGSGYTVAAGCTGLVIFFHYAYSGGGNPVGTAAHWNGHAATLVASIDDGTSLRTEAWAISQPPAGTGNIDVTHSGTADGVGGSISNYSGGNLTTVVAASFTAQDSSGSTNATITTGNISGSDYMVEGIAIIYSNTGQGNVDLASPGTIVNNGSIGIQNSSGTTIAGQLVAQQQGSYAGTSTAVTWRSNDGASYKWQSIALTLKEPSTDFVDHITAGSLTLTGKAQSQARTELIAAAALHFTGSQIGNQRTDPITAAHLTLSAAALSNKLTQHIAAAHLTLTPSVLSPNESDKVLPAALHLGGGLLKDNYPNRLLITWTSGPILDTCQLIIYGQRTRRPSGPSTSPRSWKLLKISPAGQESGVDVYAEYVSAFGNIRVGDLVPIRLVICSFDGITSAPVEISAIAT